MLDSILPVGSTFTWAQFALCTVVSLVLGLLCALLCQFRSQASKGFVVTVAMLPLIVQGIIMLVNGNLGTGVAVMGAFGLVRFRSLPGGAREIGAIFMAMAVGLATGTGYLAAAAVFVAVAGLVQLILLASPLAEGNACDRELKITVPETLEYEGAFDDLFRQYTRQARLLSVRTSGMGSVFELRYRVRMRDGAGSKAFLDALRCRNGNLPVQLSHTDTKEELL